MSNFIQDDYDNQEDIISPVIGEDTSEQMEYAPDESSESPRSSSSLDNIFPMDKMKNGLFAISKFMTVTGNALLDRVVEINQSDEVQSFKAKASETSAKAWESTKATAGAVGAAVEPTMEKVASLTAESATSLYRSASLSYVNFKSDYFSDSTPATTTEEIPSALDQASKGGPHSGPMTI